LDVATLKQYRRTFKLRTRHNISKGDLVSIVSKHFATIPVNENDIIAHFLEAMSQKGTDVFLLSQM
jgi:histone deacetylase complex subunit SAP30